MVAEVSTDILRVEGEPCDINLDGTMMTSRRDTTEMTCSKGIHPQMAEAFGDFLLSFCHSARYMISIN